MKTQHYRLNYEISPWLPEGSIWFRREDGEWGRQDRDHSLGKADEGDVYWFTLMLEQERTSPSGGRDTPRIITEVEERLTWTEVGHE